MIVSKNYSKSGSQRRMAFFQFSIFSETPLGARRGSFPQISFLQALRKINKKPLIFSIPTLSPLLQPFPKPRAPLSREQQRFLDSFAPSLIKEPRYI